METENRYSTISFKVPIHVKRAQECYANRNSINFSGWFRDVIEKRLQSLGVIDQERRFLGDWGNVPEKSKRTYSKGDKDGLMGIGFNIRVPEDAPLVAALDAYATWQGSDAMNKSDLLRQWLTEKMIEEGEIAPPTRKPTDNFGRLSRRKKEAA